MMPTFVIGHMCGATKAVMYFFKVANVVFFVSAFALFQYFDHREIFFL